MAFVLTNSPFCGASIDVVFLNSAVDSERDWAENSNSVGHLRITRYTPYSSILAGTHPCDKSAVASTEQVA